MKYTIIFYEAPHRIKNTLNNIKNVFGNRRISLAREISKLYEEIFRGTISDIVEQITDLKGELVLIVEGNNEIIDFSSVSIEEHIKLYLDDGLNEKEAMKKVAKERNVSKSIIYKEYKTGSEKE